MEFYQFAVQTSDHLKSLIQREQHLIDQYPDGELVIRRNLNRFKWFHVTYNQNGTVQKRVYIPKKNQKFAAQLAEKQLHVNHLKSLLQEDNAISQYLSLHDNALNQSASTMEQPANVPDRSAKDIAEFLNLLQGQQIGPSGSNWATEPYEQSQERLESCKYQAANGLYVRSKSEVIIADQLFFRGIPYRYEMVLQIRDTRYVPDFTIKDPDTGRIYYWENFGMMDQSAYRQKTLIKINDYISADIIPDFNFIMTFETQDHPLSAYCVSEKIRAFFG